MCAGYIANRVYHYEHDQTECKRDSHMRDRTATYLVDDNCAGSSEHKGERADKFCTALFHRKKSTDSRSCIFLLFTQQRQNDMTFSVVATATIAADL